MGLFGDVKNKLSDAVNREKSTEDLEKEMVEEESSIEEHLIKAGEKLNAAKNYDNDEQEKMADINFLQAFAHLEAAKNLLKHEMKLLEEKEKRDMNVEEETKEIEEELGQWLGPKDYEYRNAAQAMLKDGWHVQKASEDEMLSLLNHHTTQRKKDLL